MNLLYLADPNSIHDVRWINAFAEREGYSCFVVVRRQHFVGRDHCHELSRKVRIVATIQDPSTIRVLRTCRQVFKIRDIIRKFDISLFHILYAEPNALWSIGKRLFGVPMMLTTHGTDVLKTIPDFFVRKDVLSRLVAGQYRSAVARFDAIVCTSQSQLESVVRIDSSTRNLMTLIRMGVDFDGPVEIAKKTASVACHKPFVFMPRNMKPIYNHEFTLESIALLNESIRRQYAFIFINSAGEDDAYYKSIRRRAQSIEADIRFLSPLRHDEIVAFMKQCALVVMNPRSDGSPATAMEAMACRRPLILPPLSYDQEIFGRAFFFKEWVPVAMTGTIEKVLSMDADELAEHLERGFRAIFDKANFANEMRKCEGIYRQLISQ